MNSTYDTSRDRETTYAVRDLESRVQRLEIREAQFEKRCEDLILLVKAQMWSEIWWERLKAATVVMAAIALIVWARLIVGLTS